ncbi:MAG TPA: anhydro-N-acetylmuramic acid kinase [Hyphomicrobiaceae bacterium]|nr:anhydro-N-acetylmuramic acid kinase [Hyphomicrobiaceae bacterium]
MDTDGEDRVVCGPSATFAYAPDFRHRLAAAIDDARELGDRTARPGCLCEVERELTARHAAALKQFLSDQGLMPANIDVVGFHGQSVLHAPERRLTVQLGDGRELAGLCGIDVVYDLRAADVAAGGQGAPLVPVYHRAMVARLPERPLAVVNIGGVANITWIGHDGTLIAFDTGPGNALIDDWMHRHTGKAVDAGGSAAARGRVDEDALNLLLMSRYFGRVPPKSLDRNAFDVDPVRHLSTADGAATLTAFTAAAIGRAREHLPEEPRLWVICGGGRRNRTLMSMIAAQVESAVVPAEAAGCDGDAVEAEAWAYLAVRSLKGLPITFPGTTGVRAAMAGGVLARV